MTTKAEARREARAGLAAVTAEQREEWGARIAERIWTLPGIDRARVILLYASMPTEVPTDRIAAEARRRGMEVSYPRCLPEGQMSLHHVADEVELVPGGLYGLREPLPACRLTPIEEIDLALVPGLAWDRRGHRLGRGAGYYDRLFAHPGWRAPRCGLFFAIQEMPAVPTEPWDARLDAIVTEEGLIQL